MPLTKDSYAHEIINDDTRLQLHFSLIKDGHYFYSPPHWPAIWKSFIFKKEK